MSRKDTRKAIQICLPNELRLRLVGQGRDWRPLPALMRTAIMSGLSDPAHGAAEPVSAPATRPVSLQLARRELQRVQSFAILRGVNIKTAALILIRSGLQKPCDFRLGGLSH